MVASRQKIIVTIFLVAVIVCAIIAYWFLQSPQQPSGEDIFRLGAVLELTGTMADVARTQLEGIELAVNEVNLKGGLKMPWGNVRVVLYIRDDETNQDLASTRALELIQTYNIHAITGSAWAASTSAIWEQVKKAGIPFVRGNPPTEPTHKRVNRILPLVWNTQPPCYSLGVAGAKFLMTQLGAKKFFFHGRSDSWGWEIHAGFKATIEQLGGEEVEYVEVPRGTPDFSANLLKAMNSGADVLFICQFGGDCVNILKQAYSLGVNKKMKIYVASMTNSDAVGLPPEVMENVYAGAFFYYDMRNFDPELWNDYTGPFVENYIATYGHPPDAYAAAIYIAVKELFRAVETAGSFNWRDIVRVWIKDSPQFTSILGPAKWNPIGYLTYTKYGWLIVKGKTTRASAWDYYEIIAAMPGPEIDQPNSVWDYPASQDEIRAIWGF